MDDIVKFLEELWENDEEARKTIDEKDWKEFAEKAWDHIQGGRLGAGAELRLDLSLGWAFPLTMRGGVAFPLIIRGKSLGERAWRKQRIYLSFGTAI